MKKFLFLFVGLLLFVLPKSVYAVTTYDMATSTNWNIRIDGAAASDALTARQAIATGDFDGDGNKDLVIGARLSSNNGRSSSGSVYIIYGSMLENYSGKGNSIDLSDSSKYSIRFDGAAASAQFGYSIRAADIDRNGRDDIVIVAFGQKSLFVVYDSQIDDYSGTGNNVDMATSSNWNIKYDFVGSQVGTVLELADMDGNDKVDVIVGNASESNNSRTSSGSLFLIYDSLIDDYSGTGNVVSLGTTSNFNLRIDGAAAGDAFAALSPYGLAVSDFDGDGKNDIACAASGTDYNSRSGSGSTYMFFNTILDNYTGTGNTLDLASSSAYNIRFDGAAASDATARVIGGDVDSDGEIDLVLSSSVATFNSRSAAGVAYVILNELLDDYSGVGNTVDLNTSGNYNYVFGGAAASDNLFTQYGDYVSDLNNDGSNEILLSAAGADYNSRLSSGSLYVISQNNFLTSGVGSSIDMASDSSYSFRYDGAAASDSFVSLGFLARDLNQDGSLDYMMLSSASDYNSRSGSGSLYIIYNFPHTISVNSFDKASGNGVGVSGSVSVSTRSITSVSGIQISLDNNLETASSWKNCTLSGSNFSCDNIDISSLASGSEHMMYVRAIDSNGFYTARSNYGSFSFFKDYDPSSVVNCPRGFKFCVHAGPNLSSGSSIVSGDGGKVIMDKGTHRDDLYITISQVPSQTLTIPFPWSQGLNTVFEIMNFDGVSAFNGYPIITTDNPFVIQLSYDPLKLSDRLPSSLKILWFNPVAQRWQFLTAPMVIDSVNHTIATTTSTFGYFTIGYGNNSSSALTKKTVMSPKNANLSAGKNSKKKAVAKQTVPKTTKTCIFGWCW